MTAQFKTAFLQRFLQRLALAQLLLFVLVFTTVQSARAQGIVYGSSIPAGVTIEDDVILLGNTVMVDGNVVGDLLAVGSTVEINGDVDGSLAAIGQIVKINGTVSGTVYVAALSLQMGSEAALGKNLYYSGLDLVMQPGSQIKRDLVALSVLGAQLGGQIGRQSRAILGPSQIIQLLIQAYQNGRIPFLPSPGQAPAPSSQQDILQPTAMRVIPASIVAAGNRANAGATYFPVSSRALANIYLLGEQGKQPAPFDPAALQIWFLAFLRQFIVMLVYGLIAIWLLPTPLARSVEMLRRKPLPSLGWGLLAIFLVANIYGVVLLLVSILLVTGLWLWQATLWELAFGFWAVSYSTLLLATVLFTLLVWYGSKILVAYMLGKWILERLAPQVANRRIAVLLLGLVLYVFLASLPTIGWVVSILATALGLGAMWVWYLERRILARSAVESTTPAPEAPTAESAVELPAADVVEESGYAESDPTIQAG